MKRILRLTFTVIYTTFLLSCVRGTIEIDTFKASLEIMTTEISDEETFVFRVHTSSKSIRLNAYNCEFRNDIAYPVGGKFDIVAADYVEFRIENVSIKETHMGKLEMTVSDPDTGKKVLLSDTFIAKQKANVNASINSPIIKSTSKLSGNTYPTVIENDDVELVLSSTFKRLILIDFDCDIDTQDYLQRGMAIDFDERGEWHHTFKKVKIEKDEYSTPKVLNFSFRVPSALDGSSIKATPVEYITVTLPKLNIEVFSQDIYPGGDFSFRLTGNREQYTVSMIECKISEIEDLRNYDKISGDTIDFSYNGYSWIQTITTKQGITITKAETVPFNITFKDTELTDRYITLSSQFSTHLW